MAAHTSLNMNSVSTRTEEHWVQMACKKHEKHSWNELTLEERKGSLLDLWQENQNECRRVLEHVIHAYPRVPLDDLEGTRDEPCLVVLLSRVEPQLSVKVFATNHGASTIPKLLNLIEQEIDENTLTKIIKASKVMGTTCPEGGADESGTSEGNPVSVSTRNTNTTRLFERMERTRTTDALKADGNYQVLLAESRSEFDLYTFHSEMGNALHVVAKVGFTETAKEILSQGYQRLLLEPATEAGKNWPLCLAVKERKWTVVKVFLEALSRSQKVIQIRSIMKESEVNYRKILHELGCYHKPWWLWSFLKREKLRKRETMKGQVMFIEAVLDTAVHGPVVDTAHVLETTRKSGEETDGVGGEKLPFYQDIAKCNIEELQVHPCFATIVDHKWRRRYGYLHRLLFILYVLFLVCLTSSLTLASKTSDPREYRSGWDGLRLFCEALSLLYLTVVAVLNSIRISYQCKAYLETTPRRHFLVALLEQMLSVHNILDVCRYTSTLLIIPLRIAGSDWQWTLASLAIILNGMRLLHYATVLPFMGKYVGTLFLVLKEDIPRIIGLFVVINFSFGGALYFALIGHYDDGNVDMVNDNSTSAIHLVWLTGVRTLIQGSILTYYGPGGFTWYGAIIYWLLVFIINVVFVGILIAQFTLSLEDFAEKAEMEMIVRKTEIIRKVDEMLICFPCVHKCWNLLQTKRDQCRGKDSTQIRRPVLNDSDEVELKECLIHEIDIRFAEYERSVQRLHEELEKIRTIQPAVQRLHERLEEIHTMIEHRLPST